MTQFRSCLSFLAPPFFFHILGQHSVFLTPTGENETLTAKANVCFLPGSAFNILQSFTLGFLRHGSLL